MSSVHEDGVEADAAAADVQRMSTRINDTMAVIGYP
jgi:hypothetical protein